MLTATIYNADNLDVTNEVLSEVLREYNPKNIGKSFTKPDAFVQSYLKSKGYALYHGHTGIKHDNNDKLVEITLLFAFESPVSDILTCKEKPLYTVRLTRTNPQVSGRYKTRYSINRV